MAAEAPRMAAKAPEAPEMEAEAKVGPADSLMALLMLWLMLLSVRGGSSNHRGLHKRG